MPSVTWKVKLLSVTRVYCKKSNACTSVESDPLYQCYPLALVAQPQRGFYHALFVDNHCHAFWDFSEKNALTIRADTG